MSASRVTDDFVKNLAQNNKGNFLAKDNYDRKGSNDTARLSYSEIIDSMVTTPSQAPKVQIPGVQHFKTKAIIQVRHHK